MSQVRCYCCFQVHSFNKLGRSQIDQATCQISRLYVLWFQTRRFLKFSFWDHRGGAKWVYFSPRGIIWTKLVEAHISYIKALCPLVRFPRASSHVADLNTRNKLLTQKLLKQGYRYHKLHKTFSYRRYFDLISKFQIGLKSLFHQGLSETWILWWLGV